MCTITLDRHLYHRNAIKCCFYKTAQCMCWMTDMAVRPWVRCIPWFTTTPNVLSSGRHQHLLSINTRRADMEPVDWSRLLYYSTLDPNVWCCSSMSAPTQLKVKGIWRNWGEVSCHECSPSIWSQARWGSNEDVQWNTNDNLFILIVMRPPPPISAAPPSMSTC